MRSADAKYQAGGHAVHSFAQTVRLRAEDDHIRPRFGDGQWTWVEVVQEAVDRAAALAMPRDKSRVATAGSQKVMG